MASNAKKKTTMAKRNREARLRERRLEKQAKKEMRKREAAAGVDRTTPADVGAVAPLPE